MHGDVESAIGKRRTSDGQRGDFRIVSASLIAVLAAAVGLHFFFLHREFYSISWDEAGRTLDAYSWVNHGTVLEKSWLPFYRVLVGFGLKMFPDLIATPRFITLFFGLAAIVACGWLAWELFQSRRIALLTSALAAFFPQRIALTLAPLSEIIFSALILAAGALLARAMRIHSQRALLWCGLFGGLATTVRYEGWVFAACMFIAAGMSGVSRKDLLLFGGVLFWFPAIWTLNMFGTVSPVHDVVQASKGYSLMEILRRNPATEFLYMNLRSLNLIGVVLVLGILRREERRLRVIVIVFFAPLLITSGILLWAHTAQTGTSWRMIGVWSLLLLPFTAYSVDTPRTVARLLLVPVLLAAFGWEIFRIERESFWAFPAYSRQAGDYLRGLIASNPESRILIDSTNFSYLNIQVASQIPDAFVLGETIPTIQQKGVRFLAFQNSGQKRALKMTAGVRKLREFGPWSIYQILSLH